MLHVYIFVYKTSLTHSCFINMYINDVCVCACVRERARVRPCLNCPSVDKFRVQVLRASFKYPFPYLKRLKFKHCVFLSVTDHRITSPTGIADLSRWEGREWPY